MLGFAMITWKQPSVILDRFQELSRHVPHRLIVVATSRDGDLGFEASPTTQVLRLPLILPRDLEQAQALATASLLGQGCSAILFSDDAHELHLERLEFALKVDERKTAPVALALSGPSESSGSSNAAGASTYEKEAILYVHREAFSKLAPWFLGERTLADTVRAAQLPVARFPDVEKVDTEIEPLVPANSETKAERVPRVSLCMIARNEEANLSRCLGSVRDLVHEIVVVDTGSTDKTKEIAASFGATTADFPWVDDFARARNEALRYASGDWILWLDADEWLDEENRGRLRSVMANLQSQRFYLMKQWSHTADGKGRDFVVDQIRLFPRVPAVGWRFRVHEQVWPSLAKHGLVMTPTDVVIQHRGFIEPSLLSRKVERNHALLLKDLEENPNNPFVLYNLGISQLDLQRPNEAIASLRKAIQLAPATDSYLPKTYVYLVQCLRREKRIDEALATCREGCGRFPDFAELWHAEGIILSIQRQPEEARRCLERALRIQPSVSMAGMDPKLGCASAFLLGQTCLGLNDAPSAERYWRMTLANCPAHVRAWSSLADLCLAQGRHGEVLELIEHAPEGAESLSPMYLAQLDVAKGLANDARRRLEKAIERYPDKPWLPVFLAELLAQREPDTARHLLEKALSLQPNHAKALELQNRLASR